MPSGRPGRTRTQASVLQGIQNRASPVSPEVFSLLVHREGTATLRPRNLRPSYAASTPPSFRGQSASRVHLTPLAPLWPRFNAKVIHFQLPEPESSTDRGGAGGEGGGGSGLPAEVRLPGACVSSLGVWRDPDLYGLDLARC